MNNGCMGCLFFWWPRFDMIEERRQMLAVFSLNLLAICFGVTMFEGKYWGVVPSVIIFYLFLRLTRRVS